MKKNPVFKLESLARENGFDSSDAHSALVDSELVEDTFINKKKTT